MRSAAAVPMSSYSSAAAWLATARNFTSAVVALISALTTSETLVNARAAKARVRAESSIFCSPVDVFAEGPYPSAPARLLAALAAVISSLRLDAHDRVSRAL